MNKKGQINIGFLVIVAIAVIVGLILFQQVANNVETTTQSNTGVTNLTYSAGQYTAPANGACIDLVGQELESTPTVINATGSVAITSNYTIAEGISSVDNLKVIRFCTTGLSFKGDPLSGLKINVTYTYYPSGYIDNSGGRSIAAIIVLLAAIGIALVVLPKIKETFD